MSSSYGKNIKLTIFGESHSKGIGMTLSGIPAGEKIDFCALNSFLLRRAPGNNEFSTSRKEKDEPEFLCGFLNGTTCGTPITAIIKNNDTIKADYDELKYTPRPGHADYTAEIKYNGYQNPAGGGHFSGRLTAPLCIAGGICLQILQKKGIKIISRIYSIGSIKDNGELDENAAAKPFPVNDDKQGKKMKDLIAQKRQEGDSVGGIIECAVIGLDAGLGDPIFDGMENRISSIMFGIPAVKGIEFGSGFYGTTLCGSENNDEFVFDGKKVITKTNNCGGILGGITNGMPLVFKTAIKPTPSIFKTQNTVNLKTGENATINIKGRHDPCIVPRALPCVEAAAAIAVLDAYLD